MIAFPAAAIDICRSSLFNALPGSVPSLERARLKLLGFTARNCGLFRLSSGLRGSCLQRESPATLPAKTRAYAITEAWRA
jgi:hypothetical protein